VFPKVWSVGLVLTLIAVQSVFSRVSPCVMPLGFLLLLVCCFPPVLLACLIVLVNCIRRQQERIRAEEASTYAEFQQASEELEWLHSQMRSTSAKLLHLRKQQRLLEERGYAILNQESENAESLEEEDCKLLESLVSEGHEISEDHQSKRPCCDLGSNPSSSNTQTIASNSTVSAGSLNTSCPAGEANLPVDFSCLPFWDSSLVDLFSSEAVDPLVLGDQGSRGGIP